MPVEPNYFFAMTLDVGIGVAILVVGYLIAGRVGAYVERRSATATHVDVTLAKFFGSASRYAILAVVVVAALDRFGVETTSLIAVIGAAGLAVALALQSTLSNFAAGVMLILFRPFKIDDYVAAAGHDGTVKKISLFVTELATVDNVQITIPNSDIWGGAIVNYSAHSERRVDLVFGVSYDTDLKLAELTLRNVISAEARIKASPAEPFVAVTNLGDSSVDFTVRVWCDAADYWALRFDLMRTVKEQFDAAGVDIPFPTTTIRSVAAA